jgi:hypothetical protein
VLNIPGHQWLETVISFTQLCYGSIVPFLITLSRHLQYCDQWCGKGQGHDTHHLTRMLILVCAAYIFTTVPIRLYELSCSTPVLKDLYDLRDPYWRLRYKSQFYLLLITWQWNNGNNFYLYCVGGGKKYRADVRVLMKKLFCGAF